MSQFFILLDDMRRDNALAYIRALNLGKKYSVEVKEYRKNRSNSQNRLYWSWVNLIAKDTGYEPDELHETFKQRFLGTEERVVFGKPVKIAKSTAKINTQEFTAYLDRIEQTALAMGMRLPHPDDYSYAMGIEQPAERCASSEAGSGVPEGASSRAVSSGRHLSRGQV